MEFNYLIIKNKFITALGVTALLISANAEPAIELSSKIDLSLDSTGDLIVNTRHLSNYIMRGVDENTGQTGDLKLIKRNEKAIDFDIADIEWDGLFPVGIDWKLPKFETQETAITISSYNYPNGVKWQNSGIVLRGASLAGLFKKFPQNSVERIDALILFLLNTLTVAETVGEIASSSTKAGLNPSLEIMNKLKPLAEQISNFQQALDRSSTMLAFTDLFIQQMERMADAAGIDVTDENYGKFYSAYGYFSAFRQGIDSLNNTLGKITPAISDGDRSKAKGTIAKQYETLIDKAKDDTIETILDKTVNKFSNEFSQATTDAEKEDLIFLYVIEPMSDALALYKKALKNELKILKDKKASKNSIDAKKKQISFMRNGYAIIQIAKFLFATDDFLTLAKSEPQKVVPVLFDLAYSVVGELITIDNVSVVAKKALQKATGADGRSAAFRKIGSVGKKANVYMAAFNTGAGIGNRMIPLIWDLILGENYLQTSIIDGKLSVFGFAETSIEILKNNTSIGNYTNTQRSNNAYIVVKEGDAIDLYTSLYRPLLFDETRSPWLLNVSFAPKTIYNIDIITPDGQKTTILCAKKLIGDLDFSVHKYEENQSKIYSSPCGEGTWRGEDKYENTSTQTFYNDSGSDELPDKYRLKNKPQTLSDYIESTSYTVQSQDIGSGRPIQVTYDGLNLNLIHHKIYLVPQTGVVDFEADLSGINADNLQLITKLGSDVLSNEDSIINVEWNWGDGSSLTGINLEASHTYSSPGKYLVSVTVVRASGQNAVTEMEIDVRSDLVVSPPTNLTAKLDDTKVALSWSSTEEHFRIYYATESFDGLKIESYGTLNDLLIVEVSSKSTNIENLTNNLKYHFVVTALKNGLESTATNEITVIPIDSSIDLNNGLVAHYEFEDNAKDSSDFNNNGTEFGEIIYEAGAIGKAASFDGVNDFIRILDAPHINFTNNDDFTVSLWTIPNVLQFDLMYPDNDILSKWSGGAGYPFAIRYMNNDFTTSNIPSQLLNNDTIQAAQHDYKASKHSWVSSTPAFHPSEYTHIVLKKHSGKLYLYENNHLVSNVESSFNDISNSSDLLIAARGTFTNYFKGKIDDLRIYNRGLNELEINSLYNRVVDSLFLEEFNGTTDTGIAHGITYVDSPMGKAARFSRLSGSRVQYPYSSGFPKEGTLEFTIKVENAYRYSNYKLFDNNSCGLIFTTDIQGGDVTWPGSAWLYVCKNGDIKFHIAGEKYEAGHQSKYRLEALGTSFRFGEWNNIGVSFGGIGRQIKLNGKIVASNPSQSQMLGAGGTHSTPIDHPTLGESVPGYWQNNQYEGGFEGLMDRFRVSKKQQDWHISNK